jgi:hypothetical protein
VCSTSLFFTRSIQLIFPILRQHHIWKLTWYFLIYFPKCPSFKSYKSCTFVKVFQLFYSQINFVFIFCIISKLLLRIPKAKTLPLAVHYHSNVLVLLVLWVLRVRCLLFNCFSFRRTYIKIIYIYMYFIFVKSSCTKHFFVSLYT